MMDGNAHQALEYVSTGPKTPALSFSQLICNLCMGIDQMVPVEIAQSDADPLLRSWMDVILRSRNGLITQHFLRNAPVLFSSFEWLKAELPQ